MLAQHRQQFAPPQPGQGLRGVQPGPHEVGRPEFQCPVEPVGPHGRVEPFPQIGQGGGHLVGLAPATQHVPQGLLAGVHAHEHEPPAHGHVEQGDRPVGGVHGADDEQVVRQAEPVAVAVQQLDLGVAVIQEEVQLAEHLGDVGAIDLVDDEHVRLGRRIARLLGDPAQRAGHHAQPGPARIVRRPEALDEILVGVGGMELHQCPLVGGQTAGVQQLLDEVGLAGTRRALNDDLASFVQRLEKLTQPTVVAVVEPVCERLGIAGQDGARRRRGHRRSYFQYRSVIGGNNLDCRFRGLAPRRSRRSQAARSARSG